MTRRSFFSKLVIGAAAFSILPSATTYSRIWKPKSVQVRYGLNPEWVNAHYAIYESAWHITGDPYQCYFKKGDNEFQEIINAGAARFNLVDGEYKQVHKFITV